MGLSYFSFCRRGFRGKSFFSCCVCYGFSFSFSVHALTVQKVVSPGGIEAWLVEDHAIPVISMQFGFDGGALTDPNGKEGRASLAAPFLLKAVRGI